MFVFKMETKIFDFFIDLFIKTCYSNGCCNPRDAKGYKSLSSKETKALTIDNKLW